MAKAVARNAKRTFEAPRRSEHSEDAAPDSRSVAGGNDRAESGQAAPSSPAAKAAGAKTDLITTIHDEILPRLAMACFDPVGAASCADGRLPPDVEEVAELSRIAASRGLPQALAFVESKVSEGLSIGTVLLQLVAPAAKKLGDEWLDERWTFAEVTLGLAALQECVHALSSGQPQEREDRGTVLMVASRSQPLGIHVLGDSIRRAGWTVKIEPALSPAEIARRVATERYEAVALAASNAPRVEPLARLVRDVKNASMNPDVFLMVVGGPPSFADQSEVIGAVVSSDPGDAVRRLDAHVKGATRGLRH